MANSNTSSPIKPLNKKELCTEIVMTMGDKDINEAEVAVVLGALADVIAGELRRVGKVVLPGIARFKAEKKAATPARDGVNPFTKAPIKIKARPASIAVKVRSAKALVDAVK